MILLGIPHFFSQNYGSGKDGDNLKSNYAIAGEPFFMSIIMGILGERPPVGATVFVKNTRLLATLRSPVKS